MHSEWIIWGSLIIMAVIGLSLAIWPDTDTKKTIDELDKKE